MTLKVINIYGGPCSGKSTTAAGLFYHMKLLGYKVELVTEYAKELAYDGHLETYFTRQEVIFAEQQQRIHRLRDCVDYAIVDSPLLLSNVFSTLNLEHNSVERWGALEEFKQFVRAVYNTYYNINILLERTTPYQNYGRVHSEDEAEEIDFEIAEELADVECTSDTNNPSTKCVGVGPNTVSEILSIIQEDEKHG